MGLMKIVNQIPVFFRHPPLPPTFFPAFFPASFIRHPAKHFPVRIVSPRIASDAKWMQFSNPVPSFNDFFFALIYIFQCIRNEAEFPEYFFLSFVFLFALPSLLFEPPVGKNSSHVEERVIFFLTY